MKAFDLLLVAEQLATSAKGKPKQAELCRAVSSAYYALFHAIAYDAANLFAPGPSNLGAWTRIYRALEHGTAKAACEAIKKEGFSDAIVFCAQSFVKLQEARHRADYDPLHRLTRSDATNFVDLAAEAMDQLAAAPGAERRRFAAHLLFRKR